MTILEKIKTKVSDINIDELITRLVMELKLDDKNNDGMNILNYAIFDVITIILDVTHLKKVDESMYSILINMIKDYWFLNNYNSLFNADEGDEDSSEVSSIKLGDTKVDFSSKSSMININGTKYSTGTIEFDKNVLIERYKNDLYRHRKLRW